MSIAVFKNYLPSKIITYCRGSCADNANNIIKEMRIALCKVMREIKEYQPDETSCPVKIYCCDRKVMKPCNPFHINNFTMSNVSKFASRKIEKNSLHQNNYY